jgi:hypothetical protein
MGSQMGLPRMHLRSVPRSAVPRQPPIVRPYRFAADGERTSTRTDDLIATKARHVTASTTSRLAGICRARSGHCPRPTWLSLPRSRVHLICPHVPGRIGCTRWPIRKGDRCPCGPGSGGVPSFLIASDRPGPPRACPSSSMQQSAAADCGRGAHASGASASRSDHTYHEGGRARTASRPPKDNGALAIGPGARPACRRPTWATRPTGESSPARPGRN